MEGAGRKVFNQGIDGDDSIDVVDMSKTFQWELTYVKDLAHGRTTINLRLV